MSCLRRAASARAWQVAANGAPRSVAGDDAILRDLEPLRIGPRGESRPLTPQRDDILLAKLRRRVCRQREEARVNTNRPEGQCVSTRASTTEYTKHTLLNFQP